LNANKNCYRCVNKYPADNPFFDISFLDEVRTEYLDAMSNEWYIYGSSGHGRFARTFPVGIDGGYDNLFYPSPTIQSRFLKHKQYELKDHLGNVRVVVSDFKKNNFTTHSNPPYRAEVLAAYNYYPFGMLQPGMYAEDNTLRYRFGFNGMLRDDDMTDKLSTGPPVDEGRGNSYDFGARMYNPRVTRFFSLDPMKAAFTWQSPYVFAGNDPIRYIDFNGEGPWETIMFGLKHPVAAPIIGDANKSNNISSVTGRFAARSGLTYRFSNGPDNKDDGTLQNAFRHVLWQAVITRVFDSDIAKEAGDAHEVNANPNIYLRHFAGENVIRNIEMADETIDFLNNQIGRQIGKELNTANTLEDAKAVLGKFRNEGFYTAQVNEDNSVNIIKTKLTDEQFNEALNNISNLSVRALRPHEEKKQELRNQERINKIENFGVSR